MKKTLLIILLGGLAVVCKSQMTRLYYTDIDFKEVYIDSTAPKIDSILIVGVGASLERVFLSGLSDKLIDLFKKKNIFASYSYLGKSLSEIKQTKQDLNIDSFKAILILKPTDTSSLTIQLRQGSILPPMSVSQITSFNVSRKRDSYVQSFDFSLYLLESPLKQIWRASADIDCEPGKTAGPNKMARKILARLEANKYIN